MAFSSVETTRVEAWQRPKLHSHIVASCRWAHTTRHMASEIIGSWADTSNERANDFSILDMQLGIHCPMHSNIWPTSSRSLFIDGHHFLATFRKIVQDPSGKVMLESNHFKRMLNLASLKHSPGHDLSTVRRQHYIVNRV